MAVTAEAVKLLRERTGAGMMECKKALVESGGDPDVAAEAMRKSGLAKADKKASRVAAEGVVVIERSADGKSGAIVEINCETDFVARESDFQGFAALVGKLVLKHKPADLDALLALKSDVGTTVDDQRRVLIAKIGENIGVRRFTVMEAPKLLGAYLHGTRIGALVAMKSGDEALAKDIAMHVAAINPARLSASEVPADEVAKEKEIQIEQAKSDPKNKGKPDAIVVKIVEGRIAKWLNEVTLLGQPFVKDDKQTIEQLLKSKGATVKRFVLFLVGEGIEKKQVDFAAEVAAAAKGV